MTMNIPGGKARVWLLSAVCAVILFAAAAPELAVAAAQDDAAGRSKYALAIQNLQWRSIGPAIMGGRIDDFAVVESNPSIVFAGTAASGVWKTVNGGTTWEPVFDNETVSTIGDVTVAPSDPSIVWVGTGEPANRQSSSWGNGVYVSTDGGKTWNHRGLEDTHHIGRIVIHPANPDVVYVAALGRLWGANEERGVFKTTDGGKTWSKVLYINEDTGVVDIAMDPESPNTLYAAAYQRRRTAFGFNGGGPHGGLYKTTDGGENWKKLTQGLPEGGQTGRIGVNIYRSNPNIVYTLIEHRQGGIFRSEDKGETWTRMSDTNPRPMYYSHVVIDPNNDQRIWVMGAPMYYSEDGGKTFVTDRVQRIHGDYHAMWINPANSAHMIVGSDGGIYWTYDAGRTWDFVNTLALGQFYEIGFDMQKPYSICGGLQDNGSWCGPSATLYTQGITNDDWFRIGGGDGFFVQVDPTDPNIVYGESQNGNLYRHEKNTTETRRLRPEPKEGEPRYRFQWNSPVVISSHDPKTIYYGGNFLFKSTNRGDTWEELGDDLTTGVDRSKLPIMGKAPDRSTLSRNDGVSFYPTITTVSESRLNPQVLWVGTDDGNLQVTRDGGKNWNNVAERVTGVPKGTYVSRVEASRHAEGTAYVTFDGHRSNDFGVYVFATTNYGRTWKAITGGIPDNNGTFNVIREHHRNPDLLFAGGEYGGYVSFNRGESWERLKGNLPTVPVDDIAIHPRENDLILGTHGRAIWVLDDITPLEQLNGSVLDSDLHLFDIRPATLWRMYRHKGNTGHKIFVAPNPPNGAILNFYLKETPAEKEKVKIIVLDATGKKVRSMEVTSKAGLNRATWNLRYDLQIEVTPQLRRRARFFGGLGGPRVEPGNYAVKVAVGEQEASKTVVVEEDPRITISAADRAARHGAIMALYEMSRTADQGRRKITGLKASLDSAMAGWKKKGAAPVPDNVKEAAEALSKKVNEVHGKFVAPRRGLGAAGPPLTFTPPPLPQRIRRLSGALEGYTAAPLPQQTEAIETTKKLLEETLAALGKLVDEDLANLNKMMNEAGVPHITPEAEPTRPRRRRR